MQCKLVGMDLAKNAIQVCQMGPDNKNLSNRKVSRTKLLDTLRQLPANTPVAMEACAGSHHWGRQLQAIGLKPLLLPAQHVKPLTSHQKNDANDAVAICEASRTAMSSQIRGLCLEYNLRFSLSLVKLRHELVLAIDDRSNGLTHVMRVLLTELYEELIECDQKIKDTEKTLHQLASQSASYKRLRDVPGFGPLISAALVSEIGDGAQFNNGREVAAWCGLVPRQNSSGDKDRLLGITKNGNRQLRTLLIHGARAIV